MITVPQRGDTVSVTTPGYLNGVCPTHRGRCIARVSEPGKTCGCGEVLRWVQGADEVTTGKVVRVGRYPESDDEYLAIGKSMRSRELRIVAVNDIIEVS